MSIIAIITARGGSKRVPRKNIKEFMGKPMLAYAIEAALQSEIFDEVMVSTEDDEIAAIALKYGAKVPFKRSAATSSDFATTFDVINEVIGEYQKLGKEYDTLCCIYPCVPFLTPETLKKAYGEMLEKNGKAIMPVCEYPAPVEWAMKIDDKGCLIVNDRAAHNMRSQDIKPKYYDVGMFYFCGVKAMQESHAANPDGTLAYIIDDAECQDIDTPHDWQMAEMKYKIKYGLLK